MQHVRFMRQSCINNFMRGYSNLCACNVVLRYRHVSQYTVNSFTSCCMCGLTQGKITNKINLCPVPDCLCQSLTKLHPAGVLSGMPKPLFCDFIISGNSVLGKPTKNLRAITNALLRETTHTERVIMKFTRYRSTKLAVKF